MDELHRRFDILRDRIRSLGGIAVAFSGGVDSTFLLKAAHDTLGDRAIALTVYANVIPLRERRESEEFCGKEGVEQIILTKDVFSVEGFVENPPHRCYICKKALFSSMKEIAAERGMTLADGSNTDDMGDYRPGMRALSELGIISPLRDAGLSKADIRALSRELGLSTWDKPSYACLASRFPYGEVISPRGLEMVEKAEEHLAGMGIGQLRVRIHGDMARIETEQKDFEKVIAHADEINRAFSDIGFSYTSLDLGGYKTGNMNKFPDR